MLCYVKRHGKRMEINKKKCDKGIHGEEGNKDIREWGNHSQNTNQHWPIEAHEARKNPT